MAGLRVPLREISCGRAVNYSSRGLKGPEPSQAPLHRTFIRAQSAPMGPLSVRPERPWPSNINDMDHKKRLVNVCVCVGGGDGCEGNGDKDGGRIRREVENKYIKLNFETICNNEPYF